MANIKSQIKRNRQNEKRRLRNRNFRGAARTALKDARSALSTGTDTAVSVVTAMGALDRAAQKGAIHARSAARRKSRLMKQLNTVGTAGTAESAGDKKKASGKSATKKAATPAAKAKKTSKK